MKKSTSAKEFEYDGLGFPIILLNTSLIEVRGVLVPNIDYNILQKSMFFALSKKTHPLTGNEVKFVRQYLGMTYTVFANKFGVTHASVIHWEKAKNNFAKIQPPTELCIRLFILDHLHAKDKLFRDTFRNFNYLDFKTQKNQTPEYMTFDSNTLSKR